MLVLLKIQNVTLTSRDKSEPNAAAFGQDCELEAVLMEQLVMDNLSPKINIFVLLTYSHIH